MSHFKMPEKTLRIARDASRELEEIVSDFFSERLRPPNLLPNKNYSIVEKFYPDTREFVYNFVVTQPFPLKMERLVTEAIQCGKNTFDQAIYAACSALGKLPRNGKGNLHMPWSQNPTDMMRRVETKNLIPDEIRPAIYRQEPYFAGDGYSGGNDAIRQLAQLANAKHTIGFSVNTTAQIIKHPSISGRGVHSVEIHMHRQWVSNKNEVFIARTPAKAHLANNYRVNFQVALDEPAPLGNIPSKLILDSFFEKAEALIEDLKTVTGAV